MVTDRTGGFPGGSVYGMIKAAVASLTQGLAIDLHAARRHGQTTSSPSTTETDAEPQGQSRITTLVVSMLPVKRAGDCR